MGKPRKPWAILLPDHVLRFCVGIAASELLDRALLAEAVARLRENPARCRLPNEPNPEVAKVLIRGLRQPWRRRAEWVAHRLKDCNLVEASNELVATRARIWYRGNHVVDVAWVPGLARALNRSMWSKIEHPDREQAYAGQLRFGEETPRQLLKAGGHPDLGRYLLAYVEKHPFGGNLTQ